MKKIAFHLNSLERGGAERVVTNLAGQFVEHGYEVYITTQWQGEDEYEIDPRIKRVHVGLTKEQESHGRAKQFVDRIQNLKRWAKENKPDIIIAFCRKANYRALTAMLGMNIPVVVCVRMTPQGNYDYLSDKIQIPLLFPRAAGGVFQTKDQMQFFPKSLQKKSTIILNPISEKFIGNKALVPKEKAVVHSGRILECKNQVMLIEAFDEVHKKHPDYILKIYGYDTQDGTWEKLISKIEELHAGEYVKMMGGSEHLEVEMLTGEIAAFSSDNEGLPNAVLEAMALGLPVVSTDCPIGGPRLVIQHRENGLLIPVGDKEAMANAICELIENPDFAKKLGENAAKIGQQATPEAIFRQWESYINGIIENR